MSIFLGIILTLAVFFLVVLIHELGHFLTARMTGMKVLEFWFGIPPKMMRLFRDKKGTDFTLNWLPIGGFVRIFGEDPRSPEAFAPGAFMSTSLPKRLLVLVAGVVMNFFLAWVIFTGIFLTGARPLGPIPIDIGPTNSYFMPSFQEALDSGFVQHDGIEMIPLSGSIAQQAGIMSGETLLSINGIEPTSIDETIGMIRSTPELTLRFAYSGWVREVQVLPEGWKIGAMIAYKTLRINTGATLEKHNLIDASILGARETYASSMLTVKLLGKTLGDLLFPATPTVRQEAQEMLSGPIGVGGAFVSMIDLHVPLTIIALFVALLSINLGVLNIMPFPALDGGRIVTTIVYSLLTPFKNAREKLLVFEGYFHSFGFLLLLLLMLYVAFLDVGRFF